ncbi:signal recognition particle 19 kDa protein [Klebsormidium nitens]|uniref:Signal recognition particle 19 kDa protein n=1 Tax=Klebsormidium nitens TaxID=105231 RepID=A0A1Y1I0L0_KLENI|nr:signal recognition particle 19 kDa protein [Klebsormidium nitens]|eukprot:GAQ82691.1 signal recognition particle 19 kDa protein [Klebsormidium nitens]
MPECSRWNCIYPAYIDKKKSSQQGRRVLATLAAENPQAYEIADCCTYFKLPTVLELNKSYSRDFLQPGRVRVQIKREDGSPVNPAIPNRKKLLEEVAKMVPKHTGRQKKAAEPAAGGSTSGAKSGKSGKKKK